MSSMEFTYWQQYIDIDARCHSYVAKHKDATYADALEQERIAFELQLKAEQKRRG